MAEPAVENINNIERRVTITVDVAPLTSQVNEQFMRLTKTANISGFRPGKVPLDVVEQQYGNDVKSEVYTKAIEKRFGEFVQKNNIRVAGMPNIEHGSLTNVTDDFEFTATFEVFPDISISDIKKLKVIQYETTVKAEDVKKTIDVLVRQRTTFKKIDRAAKLGDRVKVKLKSFIDNKEAESTGDEFIEIVLGDTSRIKEFDSQMVGLNAGIEKSFDIKYPKDHNPMELADKQVGYQVAVIEVHEPIKPNVDEKFAKELGIEDGDIKKLNESINESLLQEVDKRLQANIKQQVFKLLVDSHKIDLPRALIDIEIRQLAETTLKKLESDGANMKDIKLEPSMFEDRAKVSCKLRLLLAHIVESHSLESSEEQTQGKIKEFSINYDDPDQAIKWFNEDPKRLQEPKALATEDNVVKWFMSQCKTEKKAINFDNVISAQFDE
ncbi:MAG: trigger factor [Methylophilaceae bacterium]|nr:trigger factor [Methylophilaceae bacterium]